MGMLHRLISTSVALVIALLLFSTSTRADSLSCTSVNGVTQCTGSDGLDCHTVDGRMICAPGAKGNCKTIGEITVCTNGQVRQTLRTGPFVPSKPRSEEQNKSQQQSASPAEDSADMWLSIQQDQQ